jgi:hypothetical protein
MAAGPLPRQHADLPLAKVIGNIRRPDILKMGVVMAMDSHTSAVSPDDCNLATGDNPMAIAVHAFFVALMRQVAVAGSRALRHSGTGHS